MEGNGTGSIGGAIHPAVWEQIPRFRPGWILESSSAGRDIEVYKAVDIFVRDIVGVVQFRYRYQ